MANKESCEDCGKLLEPMNPPAEDYLYPIFYIRIFKWKLMLFEDTIEMGCPDCLMDKQQSRESDTMNEAVNYAILEALRKGDLIERD